MWLAVPGGDTEEQLYYGTLLSLFSTLTCCLDERGREGSGVTAGCRDMLQRVLRVGYRCTEEEGGRGRGHDRGWSG